MKDAPEPDSPLRIQLEYANRRAIFYVPGDLAAVPQDQVHRFLDDLVSARAEREAKGCAIHYRPYPPVRQTLLPPGGGGGG